MNKIKVLDCTLRDGGYCNQWHFGNRNIKRITENLVLSGVDIIECGFLTGKVEYQKDRSKFTDPGQIADVIPGDRDGKMFVAMVNYGEFDPDDLPVCDGSSIDGIRVAFHKKDMIPALEVCRKIGERGYKVFIQAMVSLGYSDTEFLDLIYRSNEIKPYAFYIVDSFGVMKRRDLIRLFYTVEHNLDENILIGYHSHNNMQLAFSNAQALADIRTNHGMIIDTSIFGMGRGAGNLNTELFVEHLNDNFGTEYKLAPLLAVIDTILNKAYQKNPWGYSLPNYLSARHNAHPNYAGYLDDKKTLTIEGMNEIFLSMDPEKKMSYDRDYIEKLYTEHMTTGHVHEAHLCELQERLRGKRVLLIAPGKSSAAERDKIINAASQDGVVTISVNFDYTGCETDFIFISNPRRFRELPSDKRGKCIVTSNIPSTGTYLQTKYSELTNGVEAVKDNASMMLIKYLIKSGVKKVELAGLDGYSADPAENFADEEMSFITRKAVYDAMNAGMTEVLREYGKKIEISFVTTPAYVKI